MENVLDSPTPLADGCHHVFIDLGSNKGVHGRFLFEPQKYPKQNVSRLHFDPVFGKVNKKAMCVFAFEPNPHHKEHQSSIQKAYARQGWRYVYMPAGVSNASGSLNFYANPDVVGGKKNEFWGFGTTRRHTENNPPIPVKVIDFASWFKFHILGRCLPADQKAASQLVDARPPKIMIKMDVEGQEFNVISKMLRDGLACKIDRMIMELHSKFVKEIPAHDVGPWFKSLNHILNVDGCRPFISFDEEAYLHDGAPLP